MSGTLEHSHFPVTCLLGGLATSTGWAVLAKPASATFRVRELSRCRTISEHDLLLLMQAAFCF